MLWDAHCLVPLHLSKSQERPILFPPNLNPPLSTFAALPMSAFVHTSRSAGNAFPFWVVGSLLGLPLSTVSPGILCPVGQKNRFRPINGWWSMSESWTRWQEQDEGWRRSLGHLRRDTQLWVPWRKESPRRDVNVLEFYFNFYWKPGLF